MAGRAGGSARREYERRRDRDRAHRRSRLHLTIPFVVLAFPLTFASVHLAVWVLNDRIGEVIENSPGASTALPGEVVVADDADGQDDDVIDAGMANTIAVLFGLGATLSLARAFWGGRQTTEAWRAGAEGEELVGRRLDALTPMGFTVLHDAVIPRRRSNIDHVVVGPSGIFTVETKHYKAPVRLQRGLFERETTARRAGHRLDEVVDQARRQAETVAEALAETLGRPVPVQPLVVAVGGLEWSPFASRVTRGVRWCTAREVRKVLTKCGARLDPADVEVVAGAVRRVLGRPASLFDPQDPTPSATGGPAPEPVVAPAVTGLPTCRCGAPMVRRRRRRDGAEFLGCSTFPACRHTLSL